MFSAPGLLAPDQFKYIVYPAHDANLRTIRAPVRVEFLRTAVVVAMERGCSAIIRPFKWAFENIKFRQIIRNVLWHHPEVEGRNRLYSIQVYLDLCAVAGNHSSNNRTLRKKGLQVSKWFAFPFRFGRKQTFLVFHGKSLSQRHSVDQLPFRPTIRATTAPKGEKVIQTRWLVVVAVNIINLAKYFAQIENIIVLPE